MYAIHYKPHGALNCEARLFGPYADYDAAYTALCELPALGIDTSGGEAPGFKYIAKLQVIDAEERPARELIAARLRRTPQGWERAEARKQY